MNLTKLKLLFHTIKYLRWKQISYRLFYALKKRFFKKSSIKELLDKPEKINWESPVLYKNSYLSDNRFSFLNILHKFDKKIDWNLNNYGKLWTYNLNYFDFLNQKTLDVEDGLSLINSYIDGYSDLNDGLEPYPISLRGINWIKFLTRHKISNEIIDQNLYKQYQLLIDNLEYHLLGNHLLENGFSLFFGAFYFQDESMYHQAIRILTGELPEQIHDDGGHFELSTMYHQILLHRLLDCINLVNLNDWKDSGIKANLTAYADGMLAWLSNMTFRNGDIPLVNDAALDIALSSEQLFSYANVLNIKWEHIPLNDSGYRKYEDKNLEIVLDVGQVGPSYQPGHAHADTLSFVLYCNEKPMIIDPGISTYEINDARKLERATKFHNTITPMDKSNSSQVWSGFRVAKRAKVSILNEKQNVISAAHKGYNQRHQRSFSLHETLLIHDIFKNGEGLAYFHLAPKLSPKISGNKVILDEINIDFSENTSIEIKDYQCPLGYNKYTTAKKIVVLFKESLTTEIFASRS